MDKSPKCFAVVMGLILKVLQNLAVDPLILNDIL